MWNCIILYNTTNGVVLCGIVSFYIRDYQRGCIMWNCIILYNTTPGLYYVELYHYINTNGVVLCGIVSFYIRDYQRDCIMWNCIILYNTTQRVVLCGIVSFYIILPTGLYYVELYHFPHNTTPLTATYIMWN